MGRVGGIGGGGGGRGKPGLGKCRKAEGPGVHAIVIIVMRAAVVS